MNKAQIPNLKTRKYQNVTQINKINHRYVWIIYKKIEEKVLKLSWDMSQIKLHIKVTCITFTKWKNNKIYLQANWLHGMLQILHYTNSHFLYNH